MRRGEGQVGHQNLQGMGDHGLFESGFVDAYVLGPHPVFPSVTVPLRCGTVPEYDGVRRMAIRGLFGEDLSERLEGVPLAMIPLPALDVEAFLDGSQTLFPNEPLGILPVAGGHIRYDT